MKKMLLLATLLCACGAAASAEVPAGIGSAAFARLGVDARALAMGGAYVGVPTTRPVSFYNPACLALATHVDISALYAQPFGTGFGVSYQHTGVAMPLEAPADRRPGLGVGVSWMGVQVRDIYIWDEDDPSSGTTFTANSDIYMASVGYGLAEELAAGATVKLYRERILNGRGEGIGFDLGALFHVDVAEVPVTFGLTSADVGRTLVRWTGTVGEPDNYIAWVNKVGASAFFLDIVARVAAEFDWAVGRPSREQVFRVGAEWLPLDMFALRAGWRTDLEGRGALSAGLGLVLFDAVEFDYAYTGGLGLPATHFVSLQIWF